MPPQAPFLATVGDTGQMIEDLRTQMDAAVKARDEAVARINDLTNKVSALNGLRQAHGLPPI